MIKKYIQNIGINIFFLVLSVYYELTFILGNKPWAFYADLRGDQLFHITRLYGLKHILTNPVAFNTYYGEGNGVNFFYPWVTFYPARILSNLLNSEFKGMMAFLLLTTYLTFVLSYYSCRRYLRWRTKKSIIFSFLWTFGTYRGVDFFNRTDIGELLALICIPPLVMSFIDLIKRKNYSNWIVLALSMSWIILSHVLSALIMVAILTGLLIINIHNVKDIRLWVSLIKSVVITCLLTMLYWLPMLQQMRYIPISRPFIAILEDWAISNNDLIANSLNSNYLQPNVGIVIIFTILTGIINFKGMSNRNKKLLVISSGLIWLCTKTFPWMIFQNTVINYIQFPWRLMLVASFFAYLLSTELIEKINIKYIVMLIVFVLASHYSFVLSLPKNNVTLLNNNEKLEKISSKHFNNDYYPKASVKHTQSIGDKKFDINDKNAKVIGYSNTDTEFKFTLINNSKKRIEVDVPILYYLGIEVKNNNKIVPAAISSRGTVKINLNNRRNNVVISSRYTRLAKTSQYISLSTLLFLILILIYKNITYRKLAKVL